MLKEMLIISKGGCIYKSKQEKKIFCKILLKISLSIT